MSPYNCCKSAYFDNKVNDFQFENCLGFLQRFEDFATQMENLSSRFANWSSDEQLNGKSDFSRFDA